MQHKICCFINQFSNFVTDTNVHFFKEYNVHFKKKLRKYIKRTTNVPLTQDVSEKQRAKYVTTQNYCKRSIKENLGNGL